MARDFWKLWKEKLCIHALVFEVTHFQISEKEGRDREGPRESFTGRFGDRLNRRNIHVMLSYSRYTHVELYSFSSVPLGQHLGVKG